MTSIATPLISNCNEGNFPPIDEEEVPVLKLSMKNSIQDFDVFFVSTADIASCARKPYLSHPKDITVVEVESAASQPLLPQQRLLQRRPAFTSATVHKESKSTMLGLGFKKESNGSLAVCSLRPNCLLSEAPFAVGDKLISINSMDCSKLSLSAVARLLKLTTGLLTIVVEHPNGDPTLVESMILKATPTSKTGLGISGASSRISVTSIHKESPFAFSLLSPRDRILSINGEDCRSLKAPQAAAIITKATSKVTIVAKKGMDNAAVVLMASSA